MHRRWIRWACVLAAAAGLAPADAAAGGWWTWPRFERQTAAVGATVSVRAEVHFRNAAEAEHEAQRDWFVYLVRDLDERMLADAQTKADPGNWWSLGEATATRVGTVTLAVSGWAAVARGSLRVPRLPGRHDLMLCDDGCRNPLAEVIPVPFTVVSHVLTDRLAAQVADLRRALLLERGAVIRARRSANRARRALARVVSQRAEPAPRESVAAPREPGFPVRAVVGSALLFGFAGLLLGTAFTRRRRPRFDWAAPPYASRERLRRASNSRHSTLARSAASASRRRST